MPDPRRLQCCRTCAEGDLTLTFIFKDYPPLEDIDHLKIKVMCVPLRLSMTPGNRPDDMGHVFTVRRGLDAKITIFEKRSQPAAKATFSETSTIGMADRECLPVPCL